jgi:hypothetical protein
MVLLGDVCLVEARFSPFRDSVSLGARCHGTIQIIIAQVQNQSPK